VKKKKKTIWQGGINRIIYFLEPKKAKRKKIHGEGRDFYWKPMTGKAKIMEGSYNQKKRGWLRRKTAKDSGEAAKSKEKSCNTGKKG